MSSDKTWEQVVAELWPKPTVAEKLAEVENVCVKLMNALKPVTDGGGSLQERGVKMKPVPVFNKDGTVDCLVHMLPDDNKPTLVTSPFVTPDVPNRNGDIVTAAALEKFVKKEAEVKLTPITDTAGLDKLRDKVVDDMKESLEKKYQAKCEEAIKPAVSIVISSNESQEIHFHVASILERVENLSTNLALLLHVANAYRASNPWSTDQMLVPRPTEDVKVVSELLAAVRALSSQISKGVKPIDELREKILATMPSEYVTKGATRFAKQLKEDYDR